MIAELIIENNPYEGFFNDMELKKLVEYIDVGETADAIELGLDSKFQLECINHHLLTKCGLFLLKVRVMEAWIDALIDASILFYF